MIGAMTDIVHVVPFAPAVQFGELGATSNPCVGPPVTVTTTDLVATDR